MSGGPLGAPGTLGTLGIAVLVGLGGGVGAATRAGVDAWLKQRWTPLASLALINTLGAFILGLATGWAVHVGLNPSSLPPADSHGNRLPHQLIFPLIAAGFCGGFTTFSSVMVEVVRPLPPNRRAHAMIARAEKLRRGTWLAAITLGSLAAFSGGAAFVLWLF